MSLANKPWYKTSAWIPIGIFSVVLSYAVFSACQDRMYSQLLLDNALSGNKAAIDILRFSKVRFNNEYRLTKEAIDGNPYAKEVLGIKEK